MEDDAAQDCGLQDRTQALPGAQEPPGRPEKVSLLVSLLVNTQRRNKTKLAAGGPKPRMTAERVAKLEALGFEWVVFKRK